MRGERFLDLSIADDFASFEELLDLLEAAVWDVPVFFGPNNQKFQEAQNLKTSGGFEIHNYEEFAQQMDRFSSDAQYLKEQGKLAGQFVKGQAGATAKVLGSVTLP